MSDIPRIINIGTKKNRNGIRKSITIQVNDRVKADILQVIIKNYKADITEQGYAQTIDDRLNWMYKTSKHNEIFIGSKIIATAINIPGNIHSMELVL